MPFLLKRLYFPFIKNRLLCMVIISLTISMDGEVWVEDGQSYNSKNLYSRHEIIWYVFCKEK